MRINSGSLVHSQVVGFGDEWLRFNQSSLTADERQRLCKDCFAVFPWKRVGPTSVAVDVGRAVLAQRVGLLGCGDPPHSVEIARRNLASEPNIEFFAAPHTPGRSALYRSASPNCSGYSIMCQIRKRLSAVAAESSRLAHRYYVMSTVHLTIGSIGSALTRMCGIVWRSIARLRKRLRYIALQLNAALVFRPLARLARVLEMARLLPTSLPLSVYRSLSFYVKRTDALVRFDTRLEQRVTRAQSTAMAKSQGLSGVYCSARAPFWCSVLTRS